MVVVQVPFGGSFHNLVQWCAWTEESSGNVRLQVSCDVVYNKKWVPAKGIINSSSIEVRNATVSRLHHFLTLCHVACCSQTCMLRPEVLNAVQFCSIG